MVSKCKEKVTLTHSLPNAKELNQTQAEAFYRQTESNFKGYPAVRLQRFDELTRRGNTIPIPHATGWPPTYVSEGSTTLYEKLAEAIPHTMNGTRNILDQYQRNRDGYQALMTIMKRAIPRLGQLWQTLAKRLYICDPYSRTWDSIKNTQLKYKPTTEAPCRWLLHKNRHVERDIST